MSGPFYFFFSPEEAEEEKKIKVQRTLISKLDVHSLGRRCVLSPVFVLEGGVDALVCFSYYQLHPSKSMTAAMLILGKHDQFTHATVHPCILELQWLGSRITKYSTARWLIHAAISNKKALLQHLSCLYVCH